MILKITHQAARLLATADALRAKEQSDDDGVSYECSDGFDDHRFEGLGDVIPLNPGLEVSEDIVQSHDAAYRETWQRG